MTKFSDIIKGKFLEEFSAISLSQILIAVALAFVLSLFIVFIYRITYGGVSMDRGFVACLIMIAMVTTVVILVISSNVVLSLGMVGALSIVRFRTAVKEPCDTAFLFWAIATGIICGAGYITIAVLVTILLGLLFIAVHAFSGKHSQTHYMVVLRCDADSDAERRVEALPGYRLKDKTMSADATEIVAEVRLNKDGLLKVERLRDEPGVLEVSVMHANANGI